MISSTPYRQQAVANSVQREQLDHLLKVTAPNERMFLAALAVVILGFILWVFFGQVDRTVSVDLVLAQGSESQEVVSDRDGKIVAWLVDEGDFVEQGTPIVQLAFPQLDAKISALGAQIQAMESASGGAGESAEVSLAISASRLALLQLKAEAIANRDVVSPTTGIFAETLIVPGETIIAGEQIASVNVDQPRDVQAVARIPVHLAQQFAVGMPANVTAEGSGVPELNIVATVSGVIPPEQSDPAPVSGGPQSLWEVNFSWETANPMEFEYRSARASIGLGKKSPAALLGLVRN